MTVPIHEQALVQGGNSVFEDVWITDTLHYDFKRSGDVGFSTITVDGAATFSSDVSFAGDITLDEITCRNADVTGIATVKDLVVKEKLRDGDGNFGTSGQLLSSDGTDLVWINANTTSVANATNVGVNVNGDNSDQFISFFGSSSGNQPNRVDADFTYNPSTNTMSGINYSGTSTFNNTRVTGITTTGILEVEGELRDGDGAFGTSGQILSSDGTDTKWINTGSLTAGAASEVGVTETNTTNAAHFITFVDSSSGNENIRVDTDLTYNPSTNVISSKISDISNHDTNDLSEGSSNLYHTTARARGAISASGDLSYNSSTGVMSFSAPSAFVSGMIIIWSGNTDNIPNGFVLCDGSNSTPDLRNRFIVGAGTGSGSDYGPGDTGGSADATLVSHSHTVDGHTHGDGSLSVDNHSHSFSANTNNNSHNHGINDPGHTHNLNYYEEHTDSGQQARFSQTRVQEAYNNPSGSTTTNSSTTGISIQNNTHNHSVSGTTGNSNPGVSGSTGSASPGTNSQGSSATDANLPPYYALCYIMKT